MPTPTTWSAALAPPRGVARQPLRATAAAEAPAAEQASADVRAAVEVTPISKILIANRGEIAVRVIRTCQELGIATVAVYSTADKDSLHVNMADEAVCIGPPESGKSYLCMPNILAACVSTGAEAIHPGYGFLSENAEFADICSSMGINFIGPPSMAMSQMGDKATAKETMLAADVPCVPGSRGLVHTLESCKEVAAATGYPVMLKATAGGGGRGIKIVREEEGLDMAFKTCAAEAAAAFGNGGLYMEKFVEGPRHVEIQVMADKHGNVVALGERDCSIQRRNQKLVEEAPSPALDNDLRQRMCNAAVSAAAAINYVGAGTVEFLLETTTGEFYFMECNTRLQVEHTVTECVTGYDLVAEQIRVAEGRPLSFRQEDVKLVGHAIQARINCEDPLHGFRPNPGLVSGFLAPGGLGVRWDGHLAPFENGYRIPPNYDSLLGKLIVWAPTREQAVAKLRRALAETIVVGVPTTINFHLVVLDNPTFNSGQFTTDFIDSEDIITTLKERTAAAKLNSA